MTDEQALDALQVMLMSYPYVELPYTHTFTHTGQKNGGLYSRKFTMTTGMMVVGNEHKTQHQWVMLRGKLLTYDPLTGWTVLEGPCCGVTEVGTRRASLVLEDTEWITFHPTEETDPETIMDQITIKHTEHLKGLTQPTVEEFLQEGLPACPVSQLLLS